MLDLLMVLRTYISSMVANYEEIISRLVMYGGGVDSGSTTEQNIADRMKYISPMSLPKTFNDAISITRRLGFRYLWIDSLCIIQDSTDDWNRHCKKMSDIYSNSTLTIASLWGRSSNDGFFFDRNKHRYADQIPHVRVELNLNSGGAPFFVRPVPWNFYYATHASILHKRGWVLQERVLSPANLYYWLNEMYWECRTAVASESQPLLSNQKGIDTRSSGITKSIFSDMQRDGLVSHFGGHFTAWYLLVENFTSKQLTYASDRLPALLGLVERFRDEYSTKHIAGIWMEDLYRGLLWRRLKNVTTDTACHKPNEVLRTPSWSWVSIQGQVTFSWSHPSSFTAYYPIKRISSHLDAEVVSLVHPRSSSTRNTRPKWSLQLYVNLVKVSFHEYDTPVISNTVNLGFLLRRSRYRSSPYQLPCSIESRYDSTKSLYCARVSTWEHENSNKTRLGLTYYGKPVLTYSLLLQRAVVKGKHSLRHPFDLGCFRRVGLSADNMVDVGEFFEESSRVFLTVI